MKKLRGELQENVSMRRFTSWRAGGTARRMYQPADLQDLQVFLHKMPSDEPVYPVGLGSNLLVRDGGLEGTVLLMHGSLNELQLEGAAGIYAQAGVAGAKLARFAAKHNLCGAEFFAGIPGTLGGMLAMNAGCYGGETWGLVEKAQVVTRSGEIKLRSPQEYEIGYRHVRKKEPGDEVFVGAYLKLEKGDGEAARKQIREFLEKRLATQPLQMPNAGSVFRNPPGGHAAKLIEECGLKGTVQGGAQVSEKHANFIINRDGATAADIEDLILKVQKTVQEKTGVLLYPEVRIVGERA